MNVIISAFKISSLRNHFDPVGLKKEQEEKAEKERKEKLAAEDLKKRALRGEKFPAKAKKDDDMGVEGLEALEESPEEKQKKMHEEDFENIKLLPILEEAFELWRVLENKKLDAKKQAKKLKMQQQDL